MAEALPEECLCHIISFTSPADACCSSLVSATFRHAADSDLTWEKFLPSDFREIVSRSVPLLEFSSKKDLFRRLSSTPLLIDEGKMTFSIDKCTRKKCYMLSARKLSITWSTNSLSWSWKPHIHSRFPELVELVMMCWLEIHGKINTRILSPDTNYSAYLIFQITNRAFGLGAEPFEVSIEVGDYKTQRIIYLKREECKRQEFGLGEDGVICEREDKWLEIELGEFYNNGGGEEEVKMWFREIKGVHLKGGLLIEGIELRPKH